MRESAFFTCLVGPSPQDSIIKWCISRIFTLSGDAESAQIPKLGDAHQVCFRCLCGNVESGHPRTFSVKGLRNSQPEVLADSDAVMQYASLTDLGLYEDAPNADTVKLSWGLLVTLTGSVMPELLTSVEWPSKFASECFLGRC